MEKNFDSFEWLKTVQVRIFSSLTAVFRKILGRRDAVLMHYLPATTEPKIDLFLLFRE